MTLEESLGQIMGLVQQWGPVYLVASLVVGAICVVFFIVVFVFAARMIFRTSRQIDRDFERMRRHPGQRGGW